MVTDSLTKIMKHFPMSNLHNNGTLMKALNLKISSENF